MGSEAAVCGNEKTKWRFVRRRVESVAAVFVFFWMSLFVAGCDLPEEPRPVEAQAREAGGEQDMYLICTLSAPKKILEKLVSLVARSQPSLSWIQPKAMIDLVVGAAMVQSPALRDLDLHRSYWFLVAGKRSGEPSPLVAVPVVGREAAKRIMDRGFEPAGTEQGMQVHRWKDDSRDKVYWKALGGYLVASDSPRTVERHAPYLLEQFAKESPDNDLSLTVGVGALERVGGLSLNEAVAMVAVIHRLGLLSDGPPSGLADRLDRAWSAHTSNTLSRWVEAGDQVEALELSLDFGPEALAASAEVTTEWLTWLALKWAAIQKPGSPMLPPIEGSPFLIYSQSFGPAETKARYIGAEIGARALLEGAFSPGDLDKVAAAAGRFWAGAGGEITVTLHAEVEGGKRGEGKEDEGGASRLALTGAARTKRAEEVRGAMIEVAGMVAARDLTSDVIGPEAMVLKRCAKWAHGSEEISGFVVDWARVELEPERCPDAFSSALKVVFGRPAVELAQITGTDRVFWTAGYRAVERARGLARSQPQKDDADGVTEARGLVGRWKKSRSQRYLGLSLLGFISETELFGLASGKGWLEAMKKSEPGAGPSLEWNVDAERGALSAQLRWPVRSFTGLIRAVTEITGFSLQKALQKAALGAEEDQPEKAGGSAL
jgi:hypothetical protein